MKNFLTSHPNHLILSNFVIHPPKILKLRKTFKNLLGNLFKDASRNDFYYSNLFGF